MPSSPTTNALSAREWRYCKLVRDKTPRFFVPGTAVAAQLRLPVARVELRKKLLEEATEYALAPSMDELADVLEVVHALVKHDLGSSHFGFLDTARLLKRDYKGGFDELTGMYLPVNQDAD